MTADEYRARYKFPKDLRACFVTRKDWPGIEEWIRKNQPLAGSGFTEEALFHGDSCDGDTRYNCLFLSTDGWISKWSEGAQDAAMMEEGMSSRHVNYENIIVLSASLFKTPQAPPPELDF